MSGFISDFASDSMFSVTFGSVEDEGYASRSSFGSPCHKHIRAENFGSPLSEEMYWDEQSESHTLDSVLDSLLFRCCETGYQCFEEDTAFSSRESPELWQDAFGDICMQPNFPLVDSCENVTCLSDAEVGVVDKQSVLDDCKHQFVSCGLGTIYTSDQFRQNVTLQIHGGTITNRLVDKNSFPSFASVTHIGYVGALSCPVVTHESMLASEVAENWSSGEKIRNETVTVNKICTERKNSRCKRELSFLLDHDYLKLITYSKPVQKYLLGSSKQQNKAVQSLYKDGGIRHLKSKTSHRKQRKAETASRDGNTSEEKSKSCQYITLPGRHKSDFVYFAEKQPWTNERRSSRYCLR